MSSVYSACFSFSSPNSLSPQDFRETDDGVERSAEFVGHIGEKFRLVAVGGLDLHGSYPRSPGTAARFGLPGLIASRRSGGG